MLKNTSCRQFQGTMLCLLGLAFCISLGLCSPVAAQLIPRTDNVDLSREQAVLIDSQLVLRDIMQIPAKSIPEQLLQEAEAVAIFPDMVKGGFVVGLQHGVGVLVVKNENGTWENPRFATLTGGSIGFQVGIQAADVILVLCSRRSVQATLEGQIKIGVDATVTAGPVGRQATAETDFRLQSEVYSYSRSRGIFLGAAIDGSVLEIDNNTTTLFYQKGVSKEAQDLTSMVASCTKTNPAADVVGVLTAQVEATRTKLVEVHAQLQAVLEPQWKAWLSLPPDAFAPNGQPAVAQLVEVQSRFTIVKNDPKYKDLQEHVEFQETSRLLDQFISQLNALAETKAAQETAQAANASADQSATVPPAAGTLNPQQQAPNAASTADPTLPAAVPAVPVAPATPAPQN